MKIGEKNIVLATFSQATGLPQSFSLNNDRFPTADTFSLNVRAFGKADNCKLFSESKSPLISCPENIEDPIDFYTLDDLIAKDKSIMLLWNKHAKGTQVSVTGYTEFNENFEPEGDVTKNKYCDKTELDFCLVSAADILSKLEESE